MIINDAGNEAVNLQCAGAFIFFDLPWSLGTYIQSIGRIHRIGSKFQNVLIYSLVNRGTVDEHAHNILMGKLDLVETVFGEDTSIKLTEDNITNRLMKESGVLTSFVEDQELGIMESIDSYLDSVGL